MTHSTGMNKMREWKFCTLYISMMTRKKKKKNWNGSKRESKLVSNCKYMHHNLCSFETPPTSPQSIPNPLFIKTMSTQVSRSVHFCFKTDPSSNLLLITVWLKNYLPSSNRFQGLELQDVFRNRTVQLEWDPEKFSSTHWWW